ncbi:TraR/DksA family transcriptional regulator [Halopseudomonas phragmitis]|uniref:Conjugal transfer protein TraR n=2 Tax=Pseudomonadaceae TaxID=135621 RepID=A0A1V0B3N4_9GAMM|nr:MULTISPECIES: TraR/DksA family transcriptional regulator [Pseudomonadaceae]AQZ94549.1 conjugal transfer protein TraR [Halopseudomonas phragmitis]PAU88277.1 conjugal transfer protein TraR [Pseudomonas sp. WN033]RHW22246.1 TraR/DksA family transcriptional regulator [Pseudomonas jilinensis]
MSDTTLSRLQRLHDDYAARSSALRRDLAARYSSDTAEQAQERENDEVMEALLAESSELQRRVALAIERYKQGEYGICQRCGEAIAPARLEALPAAEYCIGCADLAERQ